MKRLLERLLERRAEALARRISPFLANCDSVLDIGCGTGHNAAALRALRPRLLVYEADVVDMKSWVTHRCSSTRQSYRSRRTDSIAGCCCSSCTTRPTPFPSCARRTAS